MDGHSEVENRGGDLTDASGTAIEADEPVNGTGLHEESTMRDRSRESTRRRGQTKMAGAWLKAEGIA